MHYILPVSTLTQDLFALTEVFCERYQIPSIDQDQSRMIIMAFAENVLFGHLHWTPYSASATSTDFIESVLNQHFNWFVGNITVGQLTSSHHAGQLEACIEMSERYYEQVIANTVDRIRWMVESVTGRLCDDDRWCVWHTVVLGGDLVVEKGRDYRILDYEQRVLNGQLRPERFIIERIKEQNRWF